ncbi:MAG: hypothetical protein AAFR77_06080 [Cyanobacteria bacterium J06631_2]
MALLNRGMILDGMIPHYLARLHQKTLCYSKSLEIFNYSIKSLIRYLKFADVSIPVDKNIVVQSDRIFN